MSSVTYTTDEAFEADVIQSDTPVLVDFYADWCGPCKALGPVLEQVATEYEGRLKVVKVDVDEQQQVATTYGIRSIPTMMLFAKGEVKDNIIGAMPKEKLASRIDAVLGAS